jgi:hypothetical protein
MMYETCVDLFLSTAPVKHVTSTTKLSYALVDCNLESLQLCVFVTCFVQMLCMSYSLEQVLM